MLRPLSACSCGVSRVQLYSLSLCNSSWLEWATEGTDTLFLECQRSAIGWWSPRASLAQPGVHEGFQSVPVALIHAKLISTALYGLESAQPVLQ